MSLPILLLLLVILVLGIVAWASSRSSSPNPSEHSQRGDVSLNGTWQAIVDQFNVGDTSYRNEPRGEHGEQGFARARRGTQLPREGDYEIIEHDFDAPGALQLRVPGDWNTQVERLHYYEGPVWYKRTFTDPRDTGSTDRLLLRFEGANYKTTVYIDGRYIGEHEGGFTPFEFELPPPPSSSSSSSANGGKEEHTLVVRVDSRRIKDGVPSWNYDWFNYGGITRDVLLRVKTQTYISDYALYLQHDGSIGGYVQLDGPNKQPESGATVRIVSGDKSVSLNATFDQSGRATVPAGFTLEQHGLERWSPERPTLYDVLIEAGADVVGDRIGFCTVRASDAGDAKIFVNDKSVFLRGINMHEVAPPGKRLTTLNEARALVNEVKRLGANAVRMGHYPNSNLTVRAAEEAGLLIWSEIPVVWVIQWSNERTRALAHAQLRAQIERDKNRCAVAMWSVGNETWPRDDSSRLSLLRSLTAEARRTDPARRPVTAALETRSLGDDRYRVEDPAGEFLDVIGVNEYLGWYSSSPDSVERARLETAYPNKPHVISEFGVGAVYGRGGSDRWSEAYQKRVYEAQLSMIDRVPWVRGVFPWTLVDFRSPRRMLASIQDGFNRKGLIANDNYRKKKAAYYVVRDDYHRRSADGKST